MTRAGIDYCVLKGVASAHYYPAPLLRHMGDVDFFINEWDLDRTVKLLIDDGFEEKNKSFNEEGHHRVFVKPGMHFELHYEVAGVPKVGSGERVLDYLNELTTDAVPVNEDYAVCKIPSHFHHGLIMLLHMQHHIIVEGIGLRHLSDWAVFVNRFDDGEFVDIFKEKLCEMGLWKFAGVMSLAASMYMGLPERPWMEEAAEDRELASAMMMDVLWGGQLRKKAE